MMSWLMQAGLKAQEKLDLSLGADLVSRYIFRGEDLGGPGAQIQPWVACKYGNIEVGAWGDYALTRDYQEMDFFATYNWKFFGLTAFNYNIPVYAPDTSYVDSYAELTLSFDGGDDFPIYANINRYVYNWDAWYIDAGIKFNTKLPIDINVGYAPQDDTYAGKAGIVHLGLAISDEIRLNETFKLPVFTSFIINPVNNRYYFLFGISLSSDDGND